MTYQASKKTDFTVDLIWWCSLMLAPIMRTQIIDHSYFYRDVRVFQPTTHIHKHILTSKWTNYIIIEMHVAFGLVQCLQCRVSNRIHLWAVASSQDQPPHYQFLCKVVYLSLPLWPVKHVRESLNTRQNIYYHKTGNMVTRFHNLKFTCSYIN